MAAAASNGLSKNTGATVICIFSMAVQPAQTDWNLCVGFNITR
jgi:hypothetical protein